MDLLIATNNRGKREEIEALFAETPVHLVAPAELAIDIDVEETGSTYAENARLKAEALCKLSGLPTLADDTGLEVQALDGRPGLHSARYVAGEGATDADRRGKLLAELQDKPQPWLARFVCVIAFAIPDGETKFYFGEVCGEITHKESGNFGFGYDRIFHIPQVNKTLAELDLLQKNQISHRAMAVKAFINDFFSD